MPTATPRWNGPVSCRDWSPVHPVTVANTVPPPAESRQACRPAGARESGGVGEEIPTFARTPPAEVSKF
jgi:hypothetical protein